MTEVARPGPVRVSSRVKDPIQVCVRCLYDVSIPGVTFDVDGQCSYCALHDQ